MWVFCWLWRRAPWGEGAVTSGGGGGRSGGGGHGVRRAACRSPSRWGLVWGGRGHLPALTIEHGVRQGSAGDGDSWGPSVFKGQVSGKDNLATESSETNNLGVQQKRGSLRF